MQKTRCSGDLCQSHEADASLLSGNRVYNDLADGIQFGCPSRGYPRRALTSVFRPWMSLIQELATGRQDHTIPPKRSSPNDVPSLRRRPSHSTPTRCRRSGALHGNYLICLDTVRRRAAVPRRRVHADTRIAIPSCPEAFREDQGFVSIAFTHHTL